MNEKKKVLVICRSSVGQMYLGVVLNRIWYTPFLAKTVAEGLLLARGNEFSLVLFDADLPDDERIAAAETMKADPFLAELPRVALLTTDNYSLPESLLPEGWAAIISKPITEIDQLYDVLRRLSDEPRKTPRVPVRMRVEIEEQAPKPHLTAINISEGGIYLRTHAPLLENTLLHLSFTLPLDPDLIQVAGTVVRSSHLSAHLETEPGMGLRFIDITEDAKNKIRNFVQWSLIGDLEWETALDSI